MWLGCISTKRKNTNEIVSWRVSQTKRRQSCTFAQVVTASLKTFGLLCWVMEFYILFQILFYQHQRTFRKDSAISDSYTHSEERLDIFYNTENMPRRHVYQPSSTGKPGQLTTTPIQPQSDRYNYCYYGGGSSRSLSYKTPDWMKLWHYCTNAGG
mgnify:CR=1 FL=1